MCNYFYFSLGYICKTYLLICNTFIGRQIDVFKMFMIYWHLTDVCHMFVHSRCFPDQEIFNRLNADVRVLSGWPVDRCISIINTSLTWNDLMKVHSRLRMPSKRLSSFTRRMTRKSRKSVIDTLIFSES